MAVSTDTVSKSDVAKPVTKSSTVTVACKLPHGLTIRDFVMRPTQEAMQGGFREVMKAHETGKPHVTINGYVAPYGMAPQAQVSGGYALTHNVDADVWNRWLENNIDSDMVRRGLIFACESRNDAKDMARERKDVRSGFEPMDPDKPPQGIGTRQTPLMTATLDDD